MASKTVQDLPDPLQPARVPSAAATDDMLARMADEAINQLMADAERDEFPKLRTTLTPPPQLRSVEDDIPPQEAPAPDKFAEVLDQRVTSTEPMSTAVPVAPGAAHGEIKDANSIDPNDELPPAPAADMKALLAEVEANHESPSLALLPLRVVNAPFANASDKFRTIIGQVAIVTLINAIAVMGYVLIFRRHH